MKRKSLLIAAAAAAFVFAAPITAEAATPGWSQIDGSWFYADEEGNYASHEWVDGNQYYVDYNGMMVSGGSYATREKFTKEVTEDDYTWTQTYYKYTYRVFDEKGCLISTPGWACVDGTWYWINDKGTAGLVNDDAEDDYTTKAGWVNDGGTWYYVDSDGQMALGSVSICDNPEADSKDRTYTTYLLKNDGSLVTGWYNRQPNTTYGKWVYADNNGVAKDGWLNDGGTWYYFNEGEMISDGTYVTGKAPTYKDFTDENGKTDYDAYYKAREEYEKNNTYYFDRKGALVYGWYHYEYTDSLGQYYDNWYYTNPNTGVVVDGWVSDGGTWYYMQDGQMARNHVIYDDKNEPKFTQESPKYPDYDDPAFVNADGTRNYDAYNAAVKKYNDDYRAYRAAKEKYNDEKEAYQDSHYYIFNDKGAMVTGWYSITDTYGTDWYYADSNGVGRTGWLQDGGNWYYIFHGRMLVNQFTPDGYYVDANGICK